MTNVAGHLREQNGMYQMILSWENTLDIKATKYLSTTLSFQLYYNRAQNVDVQTRTLLSVGLTYTFKNK